MLLPFKSIIAKKFFILVDIFDEIINSFTRITEITLVFFNLFICYFGLYIAYFNILCFLVVGLINHTSIAQWYNVPYVSLLILGPKFIIVCKCRTYICNRIALHH